VLVGISGKAGSGKDTLATAIVKNLPLSRVTHFAEPLKDAVRDIFGFSYDQVNDSQLKEIIDPYWGISPRQALQKLGTEGCRDVFGKDIWVKSFLQRALSTYSPISGLVVADVRFIEEFTALKRCGAVMVRIHRNVSTTSHTTHSSETGLDGQDLDWDFVIDNHGTLEELKSHAMRISKMASSRNFREGIKRYAYEICSCPSTGGGIPRFDGPS
jgi:hypothetical protein